MVKAAEQHHPLENRTTSAAGIAISPVPDSKRISLRAPSASLAALSKALGLTLPRKPKTTASTKTGRMAAWLGPDEWIIVDTGKGDSFADCAKVEAFHSAVDISHRNIGISVTGARAALVLNSGCPRDLSLEAFPAGAATRTILGKAEIILLRESEDRFHLECWRSFGDYVFTLLSEAALSAPES